MRKARSVPAQAGMSGQRTCSSGDCKFLQYTVGAKKDCRVQPGNDTKAMPSNRPKSISFYFIVSEIIIANATGMINIFFYQKLF